MKNTLKIFSVALLLLTAASCLTDDSVNEYGSEKNIIDFGSGSLDATFDIGLPESELEVPVRLVGGNGNPTPSEVIVTYEVDPEKTTAVEGVNYEILNNATFTFPANATAASFPVRIINSSLDPELETPLTLALRLKTASGDFPVDVSGKESSNTLVINLKPLCPITEDLSGTHTYVQYDMQYGDGNGTSTGTDYTGTITGTVTWTEAPPGAGQTAGTVGVYSLDDASFGLYGEIYDDDPAVGPDGAFFTWVCREFLFSGSDQYADTFTYNIISVNGPVMIFSWTNTWGDGGTVELTREGGADWPEVFQTD